MLCPIELEVRSDFSTSPAGATGKDRSQSGSAARAMNDRHRSTPPTNPFPPIRPASFGIMTKKGRGRKKARHNCVSSGENPSLGVPATAPIAGETAGSGGSASTSIEAKRFAGGLAEASKSLYSHQAASSIGPIIDRGSRVSNCLPPASGPSIP
jgi:hypothetical protein